MFIHTFHMAAGRQAENNALSQKTELDYPNFGNFLLELIAFYSSATRGKERVGGAAILDEHSQCNALTHSMQIDVNYVINLSSPNISTSSGAPECTTDTKQSSE